MTHKEYFKLLNTPSWNKFRHIVLSKKGYKCEQCGSKKTLAVHHPYYEKDKNLWDYKPEEMEILCRRCHYRHHFSGLRNPSDSMKHGMFIIKSLSKEYEGLKITKLKEDFNKEFPNTIIYEAITILNNQKVIRLSNGKVHLSSLYWVK